MTLMAWTDKLSVGIAVIDDDHKKLVGMVNELYDAMRAGHGKDKLGGIPDRLVQYTKFHFAREEKLFAQTAYPGAVPHKEQLEALTRQVIDVQKKYNGGADATLS